jgi:hypothetical protein
MTRIFSLFIASLRYLFALAVLALVVLAMGSLGRGLFQLANLALTGGFVMEPGSGALVVPYFVRAAFLYFLAVAFGSLFVGDIPAPQWMMVKNLFQFRTKVLTFVSVILPLGFMGKMMEAENLTVGIFYSGAGVFLVLLGIFFLIRYGSPSGDEGMAREGNMVTEVRPQGDKRQENRPQDNRRRDERRPANKPVRSAADQAQWLEKQKEDLKFQKESLDKAVDKELSGESGDRPTSHVTVRPAPTRPRGRKR